MTQTLLRKVKLKLAPPQADIPTKNRRFGAFAAPIAFCLYVLFLSSVMYLDSCRGSVAVPALPNNPDVLIAGSSVIATPLALIESNEHGFTNPDSNRIRRIAVVQRALAAQGSKAANVWSAAMAGQNIEETADFVDTHLVGEKKPRVLALFVAPLFFAQKREQNDWQESFDQLLARSASGFGLDSARLHHWRLNTQLQLSLSVSRLYLSLGLSQPRWRQMEKTQNSYARFYAGALSDNRLQLLRKIGAVCNRRGIRVLFVSTPLASENRALMKQWSYADFHHAVAEAVAGSDFVDLGDSPRFRWPQDFDDSAHTNDPGGRKMIDMIAPTLASLLSTKSGASSSSAP